MDFHTKSYKSPDPEVPIQRLVYATVNTNCKLGLPVSQPGQTATSKENNFLPEKKATDFEALRERS